MKILAISDLVAPQVYDVSIRERFAGVDLVLACGDLPHYYLEYIVTMLNVSLYYVMGNHGCELAPRRSTYGPMRPEGCVDLDERVADHGGLLVAGLEGSMRYKEGPHQYSQSEMSAKLTRLTWRLLPNRALRGRWLDILITHAPPYGIHDASDLCHTGFRGFVRFMDAYKPRYLLHGHSHAYNPLQATSTEYCETTVVNVYPYRVLEIGPSPRHGK